MDWGGCLIFRLQSEAVVKLNASILNIGATVLFAMSLVDRFVVGDRISFIVEMVGGAILFTLGLAVRYGDVEVNVSQAPHPIFPNKNDTSPVGSRD